MRFMGPSLGGQGTSSSGASSPQSNTLPYQDRQAEQLHTREAEGDARVIRHEFQPEAEEGVGGEVEIKQGIVARHAPAQ
jgi:hypothetical protein